MVKLNLTHVSVSAKIYRTNDADNQHRITTILTDLRLAYINPTEIGVEGRSADGKKYLRYMNTFTLWLLLTPDHKDHHIVHNQLWNGPYK